MAGHMTQEDSRDHRVSERWGQEEKAEMEVRMVAPDWGGLP